MRPPVPPVEGEEVHRMKKEEHKKAIESLIEKFKRQRRAWEAAKKASEEIKKEK